jgi:hypothetical protein
MISEGVEVQGVTDWKVKIEICLEERLLRQKHLETEK